MIIQIDGEPNDFSRLVWRSRLMAEGRYPTWLGYAKGYQTIYNETLYIVDIERPYAHLYRLILGPGETLAGKMGRFRDILAFAEVREEEFHAWFHEEIEENSPLVLMERML